MALGRWVYIILGFVVTLCLGVNYAYSILRVHLESHFARTLGAPPSTLEMQAGYTLFLVIYSLSVAAGGFVVEKTGPRAALAAGAVLLGLAWLLGSLADSPLEFAAPYGLLGGLGAGVSFNTVVSLAVRWFPEKSGLASGLAISGLGLSPLVTGNAIDYLAGELGVSQAMRLVGLALMAVVFSAGLLARFPSTAGTTPGGLDVLALVASRRFASLWLLFCIGTAVGLSAIGVSKPAGLEVAERAGLDPGEASRITTLLVSLFSIFNAAGRPLFGFLVDKRGVVTASLIAYTAAAASIIAVYALDSSMAVYAVSYSTLWATLGGWLAISSGAARRVFGVEAYPRVYGFLFTAYGAGALAGNVLVSVSRDVTGAYSTATLTLLPLIALGVLVAARSPPAGSLERA